MLKQHLSLFKFMSFISLLPIVVVCCGKDDPQNSDITGLDTTPPADVADLTVKTPTATSLALVWTAPGDDGTNGRAARYDIRYSEVTINDQNWESATRVNNYIPLPKPAGQIETIVVTNLPSAKDLHFALKTYDEVPNESGLSNCAMGTTLEEQVPPAAVSDLQSTLISDVECRLTFTATGDDGLDGTASEYDVRYSTSPINEQNWQAANQATQEPAPKAAGELDTIFVTGVDPATNYFFALKVGDEFPNWSPISNLAPALAMSEFLWAIPEIAQFGEEFHILFRASTELVRVAVWKRVALPPYKLIIRRLVGGYFSPGVYSVYWDQMDDWGKPISPDYIYSYMVRLEWGGVGIDSIFVRVQ
jgi:hypothetical protein